MICFYTKTKTKMSQYHIVLCDNISTEIFTCCERVLRDILVYFILDKYEEYEEEVLDPCVLHAYDNYEIKDLITRAEQNNTRNTEKTYIGAVICGGDKLYSNM